MAHRGLPPHRPHRADFPQRGLKTITEWCQKHRHEPVDAQQKTLSAKLRGHYQYYGRPTNYRSLQ
ncbi:MAG TPA: hypothetical protein VOA88_21255, partial [Candidatus Dormibacteraeota bacterium]|nr:hypothetical protein [Candidatus Dormibacteraeota bacterium]